LLGGFKDGRGADPKHEKISIAPLPAREALHPRICAALELRDTVSHVLRFESNDLEVAAEQRSEQLCAFLDESGACQPRRKHTQDEPAVSC
jgi:endonuclease/exonuclease/phosphatase family metal-dependent hydrolase